MFSSQYKLKRRAADGAKSHSVPVHIRANPIPFGVQTKMPSSSPYTHPSPLQPRNVPFAPPPHVFKFKGWPPLPEVIPFFGQKIYTFPEMEIMKNEKKLVQNLQSVAIGSPTDVLPGAMLRDVFVRDVFEDSIDVSTDGYVASDEEYVYDSSDDEVSLDDQPMSDDNDNYDGTFSSDDRDNIDVSTDGYVASDEEYDYDSSDDEVSLDDQPMSDDNDNYDGTFSSDDRDDDDAFPGLLDYDSSDDEEDDSDDKDAPPPPEELGDDVIDFETGSDFESINDGNDNYDGAFSSDNRDDDDAFPGLLDGDNSDDEEDDSDDDEAPPPPEELGDDVIDFETGNNSDDEEDDSDDDEAPPPPEELGDDVIDFETGSDFESINDDSDYSPSEVDDRDYFDPDIASKEIVPIVTFDSEVDESVSLESTSTKGLNKSGTAENPISFSSDESENENEDENKDDDESTKKDPVANTQEMVELDANGKAIKQTEENAMAAISSLLTKNGSINKKLSYSKVSKCLQKASHMFPLLEKGLLAFHVPKSILYRKKSQTKKQNNKKKRQKNKQKKAKSEEELPFDAKDITSCSGFDRHSSPVSDGSYGAKYVETDHGDYLKIYHDLLFQFIKHHSPKFEVDYISRDYQPEPSKTTEDDSKPTVIEKAYDMQKVIDRFGTTLIDKARELLIDFINGCMSKDNLFKTDSKRTSTKICASGMQYQEADQVKHHRRCADLSKTEPSTNTNSNQMNDEDGLGLKFAELQVVTALVNKVNLPSSDFNEAYKLRDDLPEVIKDTIYKLRMKNFESLIGPTLFDSPASTFLKENTKALRALMTGEEEEDLNLYTVRECFNILKLYLPCAAAVRAVDFCWRHSDELGENTLCPVTQAMILSIPLKEIKDEKVRKSLLAETSDPDKQCIQYMVALYGRGCTENYACTIAKEESQFNSENIDLLTKIIVKFLLESKGTDLDHQANFESDTCWEEQCAKRKEKEAELEQVLGEELAKRSLAPPNSGIRKCNTLCRFSYLGEAIDAINHLLAHGALPTVTDHLRVLFYCAISNGHTGIASIVNMHDAKSTLTKKKLMSLQKEICDLVDFNCFSGSSPLPRFQYEAVSRKMWGFFLDSIVKELLLVCKGIRVKFTGQLTRKKKDEIYDKVVKCVDDTTSLLWSVKKNRDDFARAHPELDMSNIKSARTMKALPANLLMNFLASYEYIPRAMIQHARYGDTEGPAKCMNELSTHHLSEAEGCYNKAAEGIRSELEKQFKMKISHSQLENYLCEIYRVLSKIPASVATVGDWKEFGKKFIKSNTLARSCIEWWSNQKTYQEKHHFNLHRGSMAHLFRMRDKDLIIRDSRSSNSGIMSVKFEGEVVKIEIKGIKNKASFEDYYSISPGATHRRNGVLAWLKKEPFARTEAKKRKLSRNDTIQNKKPRLVIRMKKI